MELATSLGSLALLVAFGLVVIITMWLATLHAQSMTNEELEAYAATNMWFWF